jgi:protein-S-isoprenylcysteine O-methyltransferase Ste14
MGKTLVEKVNLDAMNEKTNLITPRTVLFLLVFIVLVPLLPLIISWQWGWWEAWVYAVINILGFIVSRYLASWKHPDLIAERGKFLDHQNPEKWDKILSPLLGLGGGLIPVAAGLDRLFGSYVQFGLAVKIIAIIIILAGYALGSYALIANRFFSGVVRIQSERGHHVVKDGPYRWVRHPGYTGALISYFATPFLLESLWTFVPVGVAFFIIVVRTHLEDRALQQKLEGYREYAKQVRYRLIPGIW